MKMWVLLPSVLGTSVLSSHAWHSQAHFKDNTVLARTSVNSKDMATLAKRGLQLIEVGGTPPNADRL